MRLGLDFYETITVRPEVYKQLAQSIIDSGGEVHIITAVHPENTKKVLREIRHFHFPYMSVHIIQFTDYDQVPRLKLIKAQELKVDLFIDDRLDTCQIFNKSGILAVQSLGSIDGN